MNFKFHFDIKTNLFLSDLSKNPPRSQEHKMCKYKTSRFYLCYSKLQ